MDKENSRVGCISKGEKMELKFYYCNHCKKIAVELKNSANVPSICCGEKMTEMVAGSVDAVKEKHVPEVKVHGNQVDVVVGSVEHPMLPEHLIEFIVLETKHGHQVKFLKAGDAPKASFSVIDDEPVAVYEYCNLHGLWKTAL